MIENVPDMGQQVLARDPRAISRAATWIESDRPEAAALLRRLTPHTGHALLVGITGAPGAGKSTLTDQIARALRAENKTVAIIAVDPSSPHSGGAILGDRIRMQQHHADPGVFIRSMATRGSLGGIARATSKLAMLFDAAGFDAVVIETVGVGQAEVEIARLAAVTVVVLAPGMGDDVQAMKAGILEIADVFAINKADLPGAEKLEQELMAFQNLAHGAGGRVPKIVRTIASEGQGIAEMLSAIRACAEAGRHRLSALFSSAGSASIDHLGIAVRSIERSLEFYEGALGLDVSLRETVEQEKVHVAMLALGGPRIELLEPVEPDSVIGKFLEKRGEGLHHVALRVPDLTVSVDRLKAAGARILSEPRTGAGGHRYVFVHPASTGGVLLELIQE